MNRLKYVAVLWAVLMIAGWNGVQAATIQIDLGAPADYRAFNARLGPIPFSDLDGNPLDGASLSLDFRFTNNEFVRLFKQTISFFDVELTLLTNAGAAPGFVTSVSAYLIAQNGSAIPGFSVVGTADGTNGSTILGYFPMLADANGTPNPSITFPLDFYGVHFDFTLPDNPSVNVIGGQFALLGAGQDSGFAVGPKVSDTGNTLELFTIATVVLMVCARFKSTRSKPHRSAARHPEFEKQSAT